MYYQLVGDAKQNTMVFLHGWGTDSSSFRGVLSLLPKNNWRYLLIDFPGFGESPEPSRDYTVYDYASEVVSLLKKLSITNAVIVGHSFGGRIAVVIGSRYPEYAKKIVLVDSAGLVMNRGIGYKIKVWNYKFKKKLTSLGLLKGASKPAGSADYRVLKSDIMRKTFINVVNQDLLADAKKIKSETIIIWGKEDKDTPLKMGMRYNKAIAESKLYVIEDAGHFCFLDKIEDFVYILYDNIFI